MKRFLALMVTLMFFVTACSGNATESDSKKPADNGEGSDKAIKVAFIGNTTGDYQQYGIPVRNAVKLWFDQLNESGGINGKKVELLDYDDKGDGVEAINAYHLAKQEGATAIIGSVLTGPTIQLADETFEDNVPQITASGTALGVTVIDPDADKPEVRTNVFRSCFTDPYQGEKMAKYAKEKLDAKTVAVFYETGSDYSEGIKDAFVKTAEDLGMTVVGTEAFGTGDKDFRAQMTKLSAAKPDVIMLPIYYSEAGLAVTAARNAGFQGKFMGGDGMGSIKDYASPEHLEGMVYCSGYAPGTDSVADFEAKYKSTFSSDVPNMFAPLGYDAAMLMTYGLKAAEEKGLTPQTPEYYDAVIEALKGASNLKGITGTYSFDEQNNPIKEAAIIELKNGQEVFKEMY